MQNSIKLYSIFLLFFLTYKSLSQTAISDVPGYTPQAKSVLDVNSTSKGFLWPRMTIAQRNSISSAPGVTPEGLTVFDTDTKNLWMWKNAAWQAYLPSPWEASGNDIFNNNSGNVSIGGAATPTSKLKVYGQVNFSNPANTRAMVYDPASINNVFFSGGDAEIKTLAPNSNLNLQKFSDLKLAVGDIIPTQKVDIDGQIRIRGGSPGLGKVLTSAADGSATWQTPTLVSHNHLGESWTGTTGLSITNNNIVNNVAAISGIMSGFGSAQNTGVLGTTESSLGRGILGINYSSGSWGLPGLNAGVSGSSGTGPGVHGNSVSGPSIHGEKTAFAGTGNAGLFERKNGNSVDATVLISNNNESQTALELKNGYLKVSGATNKTAFIITAGSGGSTIVGNRVRFSYPGMSSTDILIVNHQYVSTYIGAVGNWYETSIVSPVNQWTIFREDNLAMPAGEKFTVLVIKQ